MSSMCKGGCGFYGRADQGDMCSKCFKEMLAKDGFDVGPGFKKPPAEAEGKESVVRGELQLPNLLVQVRIGDMTCEKVDVIVNAANSSLDHAAGLAGAIVKKGGRIVQIESDQYVARHGKLECGDCCLTTAGALPCKKVMHAVGPIWKDGKSGEDIYLQVCVRTCLDQADRHGFRSIAMPAISSGIFGFPKDLCAKIMFQTVLEYAREKGPASTVSEVHFTNFDEVTTKLFEAECQQLVASMRPTGARAAALQMEAERRAQEAELHSQPDTATSTSTTGAEDTLPELTTDSPATSTPAPATDAPSADSA